LLRIYSISIVFAVLSATQSTLERGFWRTHCLSPGWRVE